MAALGVSCGTGRRRCWRFSGSVAQNWKTLDHAVSAGADGLTMVSMGPNTKKPEIAKPTEATGRNRRLRGGLVLNYIDFLLVRQKREPSAGIH